MRPWMRNIAVIGAVLAVVGILAVPMSAQADWGNPGVIAHSGPLAGWQTNLVPFFGLMALMATHDCLYHGGFGCTPNAAYVKYVDDLNNAWRTQVHRDPFGREYTPKESKGWDSKEQEAYYTIR